uniref:Uncharacterized protein n=1 Tax=Zea mays TaxID=4577 RepID=C4J5X7_MAIZE|nr:unknown [Zea mays]
MRGGELGRVPAVAGHPGHVVRAAGLSRGAGAVRAGARRAGHDRRARVQPPHLPGPRLRHGALLPLPHPLATLRWTVPDRGRPGAASRRVLDPVRAADQLEQVLEGVGADQGGPQRRAAGHRGRRQEPLLDQGQGGRRHRRLAEALQPRRLQGLQVVPALLLAQEP